jgi:hypothetical protein
MATGAESRMLRPDEITEMVALVARLADAVKAMPNVAAYGWEAVPRRDHLEFLAFLWMEGLEESVDADLAQQAATVLLARALAAEKGFALQALGADARSSLALSHPCLKAPILVSELIREQTTQLEAEIGESPSFGSVLLESYDAAALMLRPR